MRCTSPLRLACEITGANSKLNRNPQSPREPTWVPMKSLSSSGGHCTIHSSVSQQPLTGCQILCETPDSRKIISSATRRPCLPALPGWAAQACEHVPQATADGQGSSTWVTGRRSVPLGQHSKTCSKGRFQVSNRNWMVTCISLNSRGEKLLLQKTGCNFWGNQKQLTKP